MRDLPTVQSDAGVDPEAVTCAMRCSVVPVETASHAIAQALATLGARRLCLVSPYPEWLTNEAIAYWREAGFEVVQVVKGSESFRAYELTDEEVGAALARTDDGAIDATVLSGTGMLTATQAERLKIAGEERHVGLVDAQPDGVDELPPRLFGGVQVAGDVRAHVPGAGDGGLVLPERGL